MTFHDTSPASPDTRPAPLPEDFRIHAGPRIPLGRGHAVSRGWTKATGGRPMGVTWHWTATYDLAACDRLLGGAAPERKGQASAHYAVGRSFAEGVSRYVSLANRSWHAGVEQKLRWDGRPSTARTKGARACIGIETVTIGHAREGVPAGPDWIGAATPDGRRIFRVEPWTEEQIAMMAAVGREIVARWPGIGPRDHHGHHDLCPAYKQDVLGFPFARVLRAIYDDPEIPDVWSDVWMPEGRQRALARLGFAPGPVDGVWGPRSDAALRALQAAAGLEVNGWWTTWVCWAVHDMEAG